MGHLRVRVALPSLMIAAGLLAGCASTATVSSTTPSGPSAPVTAVPSAPLPTGSAGTDSAALCAAAAQLKTSVTKLTTTNPLTSGVGGIQQELTTVQTNLNKLQESARDEFGPQVTAMRTALSDLQTALSAAANDPGLSTLTPIISKVTGVVTAYQALQSQISNRCK